VRVLTWNLWGRFGPWEQRLPAIAAVLASTGADVVCLQEVWGVEGGDDQAEVLARPLGMEVAARTPARFRNGLTFGNAILSRHPAHDGSSHTLVAGDGNPGHRTLLRAVVRTSAGPVPVYCTHLAYRFDESALRQRQLAQVATIVADHRGDPDVDHPAVLCGDLNAVPTSDEIRMLTGEAPPTVAGLTFTDAWAVVGNGPGWTWDADNPHQSDAYWPRRRLDYVLVSWPRPRPLGNPLRAALVGTDAVDGVVPSDHYGVVVDLAGTD
jgi:endonuclease/exonuclease/phosphatase family metal-dependent hydrolase